LVFDAIAERHRRQILDLLRLREQSVGELVRALAVSQPAVSKHLRLLRDAGLVESRVEAQRRVYRIRVEPLLEVDEWLAPYRMLWSASLNRLERHLDRMDDESSGG
jgi:DNA-binding transcriptional ArsR family regulator